MALEWLNSATNFFGGFGGSGVFSTTVTIVLGVFYAAILVGIGILVRKFLQYKYRIFVFEKTKSGISIEQDKAKLQHKDNISKLRLFKSKEEIEAPLGYITMMEKKRRWIFFERLGGVLQPLEFTINSPAAFEPISNYAQYWAAVRTKEKIEKHTQKSLWERYGNMIIFVGTMAICFVLILLTLSYAQEMAADATAKWSDVIKMTAQPIAQAGVGP